MSETALAPAADDGEVAIELFTVMYLSRKSKKLILQTIDMPSKFVEERLYDAILVSWAKIKGFVDLDVIHASDSQHKIVATKESIVYYTMHSALKAERDLQAGLEPMA